MNSIGEENDLYRRAIDRAISEVISSSSFILGRQVVDFEQHLQRYLNIDHAIACSSGTDALIVALMAIGIGHGDEVIVTPFSFIATLQAIILVGAKPVFVDIDRASFNIDIELIEEKISSQCKAIMPVSLFGNPIDFDLLNQIAAKYNLIVIEDGAQSFGASHGKNRSCASTDIACTSFYPSKPLGGIGDGGAIFTRDANIANRLRTIINQGQTERYVHTIVGLNARMDSIKATVLDIKLSGYNEIIRRRRQVAMRYDNLLKDKEVVTPYVDKQVDSIYAQYSILTISNTHRKKIQNRLAKANISTAIHYRIPMYRQPAFSDLAVDGKQYPIVEEICSKILSLPMNPFLTLEQQQYICDHIN